MRSFPDSVQSLLVKTQVVPSVIRKLIHKVHSVAPEGLFLRVDDVSQPGGAQQPAGVEALRGKDVGALPLGSARGSTSDASEAANKTTGFFEDMRSRGASEPLRLTEEPAPAPLWVPPL